MAKFNKATDTSIANYMGGRAFEQSPEEELVFISLSSFIEDSYYESKENRIDRIRELISKINPIFVAKLAIYTRTVFNMRSASHILMAELSKIHRGDSLVRNAIFRIVTRVDDITELLSLLNKPIPNGVKKGIAKALTKFNSYELAKYQAEKQRVSLVDVFNLIHPKPPENLSIVWDDLMRGRLKQTGETWEARLSSGENPKIVWKDMLQHRTLGYMATLRNLRNILKIEDYDIIVMAADQISNRENVLKSKQLPFRFLSAYAALNKNEGEWETNKKNKQLLIDAISTAAQYSVENIPILPGKTLILSDNSGSMRGDAGGSSALSTRSSRTTSDIANLFAVLYWTRTNNTKIGLFGDKLLFPELNRENSIFQNYDVINQTGSICGPSTEEGIFLAIKQLLDRKEQVDRIVIFSDQQVGASCQWYGLGKSNTYDSGDFNILMQHYLTMFPETIVYSIDLKGYGNKLFSHNIKLLAGWSDKIFDIMQLAEKDPKALMHEIEAIVI